MKFLGYFPPLFGQLQRKNWTKSIKFISKLEIEGFEKEVKRQGGLGSGHSIGIFRVIKHVEYYKLYKDFIINTNV